MPKPNVKENHGQAVSAFVHELQAARVDGEPRGLGPQVSEFASNKGTTPPPVDFQDGVITVIKDEGGTQTFTTFADALAYSDDGDTLQVGAGTYREAFDLAERVTIIGEAGAVIDGSGVTTGVATTSTIELFSGLSGGSISGLKIVAVGGGNAVASIIGEAVHGVSLTGNTFDAGANTAGALVYLNPGADGFVIENNSFDGAALSASPLLGVEGDNVQVTGNSFGPVEGSYAKVEIFSGLDGQTADIVLTGNTGLASDEIVYGA
jgi:hypothetical protein